MLINGDEAAKGVVRIVEEEPSVTIGNFGSSTSDERG